MKLSQKDVMKTIEQFIRFTGVGVIATFFHYVTLWFGHQLLNGDAVLWSFAGSIIGAVIGYILNYLFTFEKTGSILSGGVRYGVMVTLGISLNAAFMWIFVDILSLYAWYAQLISTGLVFLFNFLMSKFWVFKAK